MDEGKQGFWLEACSRLDFSDRRPDLFLFSCSLFCAISWSLTGFMISLK